MIIDSRSLDVLQPEFRSRATNWLAACKADGLDILITCTGRSGVTQDKLYAIGRTVPGAKVSASRPMGLRVTNARAGESAHQYGLALDFVPMIFGKPAWNSTDLFYQAIAIAQDCGMESLRPMESAHLQMPNWKTIKG